jgi:hypothetical protein
LKRQVEAALATRKVAAQVAEAAAAAASEAAAAASAAQEVEEVERWATHLKLGLVLFRQ